MDTDVQMSSPNQQIDNSQTKQVQQEQEPVEAIDLKPEHLNYLRKCVLSLREKGDEDSYILLLEKLLFLTLSFLNKNQKKHLSFDPCEEMLLYVEKANKKAVDTYKEGKYQESAQVVANIIDLLNQPNINLFFQHRQKLSESKILACNNLSCVYNAQKKFDLSAKVISAALQLEEELAKEHYGQSEISIISTYFNYSAILTQAKQHDHAAVALDKGFIYLDKAESKSIWLEPERLHFVNLRLAGLFMSAKEYERKNQVTQAKDVLQKALIIAKGSKKQSVIEKVEQALANLKDRSG